MDKDPMIEAADKPAADKPAPKPRKPRAKKAAPPPPPPPNSLRTMGWVVAVILVLDQISKYIVVHNMRLDRVREIELLPPWLNLHMAWNQGMNFGLLSSSQEIMRWVLIAIAVAVCAWVILWIRRVRPGWFVQTHAHPELTGRTLLEILHRGDEHRDGRPREDASRALAERLGDDAHRALDDSGLPDVGLLRALADRVVNRNN